MKKLSAFIVIGLVCLVGNSYAFFQKTGKESKESGASATQLLNLKVKDIEIGTSHSDVLKKLGKPSSSKKDGVFPCDAGDRLTMKYKGLVLELIENDENKSFFVASTTISSDKWSVSDAKVGTINIGASIKEVKEKFGDSKLYNEEGLDTLGYYNIDGYAYFYFKDKKLVKIQWELNTC